MYWLVQIEDEVSLSGLRSLRHIHQNLNFTVQWCVIQKRLWGQKIQLTSQYIIIDKRGAAMNLYRQMWICDRMVHCTKLISAYFILCRKRLGIKWFCTDGKSQYPLQPEAEQGIEGLVEAGVLVETSTAILQFYLLQKQTYLNGVLYMIWEQLMT